MDFALLCFRVELFKRKVLEQCELDQEMIYEELGQKKVAQDQIMERMKAQLLVIMITVHCNCNDGYMDMITGFQC